MITSVSSTGGHCCVCTQVCAHTGGPYYCDEHKPKNGGFIVFDEAKKIDWDKLQNQLLEMRVRELRGKIERQANVITRFEISRLALRNNNKKLNKRIVQLQRELDLLRKEK